MDEDMEFSERLDMSHSEQSPALESDDDDTTSVVVRQTQQLRRFRVFFVILLSLVAAGLAFTIYFLTHTQEVNSFKSSFEDRSDKIIDTFHVRAAQKIGALESLSIDTTSYVQFKNLTWPFVTLPDFSVKGASVRALSLSASIVLYPIVTTENILAWESYAKQNRGWIEQGLLMEATFDSFASSNRQLKENIDFVTVLQDDGERVPAEGEGPFFPAWQSSPVAADLTNLDLHSTPLFASDIDVVWETGEALIGRSEEGVTLGDILSSYRDTWDTSEFYDPNAPVDKMYFPVFDVLDPAVRRPVGIITSIMFWESFLHAILPPDQGGLYAVIRNECDQIYTYHIVGQQVDYVGPGDLHEKTTGDLFKEDNIFEFSTLTSDLISYKGTPFNNYCNYTMVLYPSQALEDEFITNIPWYFFALVLGIFFFTTMIIYCYDWRVEKNYQETYKKAKQAGAIVSSIFPAAVRRRLYQEDNSNSNSKTKGQGAFKQSVPSAVDAQKARLKGFLTENGPSMGLVRNNNNVDERDVVNDLDKKMEKPIADLFPETSILFADIVGFTAWSSQRYVSSAQTWTDIRSDQLICIL